MTRVDELKDWYLWYLERWKDLDLDSGTPPPGYLADRAKARKVAAELDELEPRGLDSPPPVSDNDKCQYCDESSTHGTHVIEVNESGCRVWKSERVCQSHRGEGNE